MLALCSQITGSFINNNNKSRLIQPAIINQVMPAATFDA